MCSLTSLKTVLPNFQQVSPKVVWLWRSSHLYAKQWHKKSIRKEEHTKRHRIYYSWKTGLSFGVKPRVSKMQSFWHHQNTIFKWSDVRTSPLDLRQRHQNFSKYLQKLSGYEEVVVCMQNNGTRRAYETQ